MTRVLDKIGGERRRREPIENLCPPRDPSKIERILANPEAEPEVFEEPNPWAQPHDGGKPPSPGKIAKLLDDGSPAQRRAVLEFIEVWDQLTVLQFRYLHHTFKQAKTARERESFAPIIKVGDRGGMIYEHEAAKLLGWKIERLKRMQKQNGDIPGRELINRSIMYPEAAVKPWFDFHFKPSTKESQS